MKKGVLIGNPVDKSISHITHNEIFKKCSVDAVYEKRNVDLERLSDEVEFLKKIDCQYFAVTMPLKEALLPYLDERKESIGSINTILVHEGKWIGYNFDGIACLNAIERHRKVFGKKVLVLGAGGAARSAIFEAVLRGGEVSIWNRTFSKAKKVAEELNVKVIEKVEENFDVVIQATSVGMFKDEHLFDMNLITEDSVAMEMVYNPMETLFTLNAKKRGAHVVYGYEMFIELSFAQFDLAFKNQIDKGVVKSSIENFFIKN